MSIRHTENVKEKRQGVFTKFFGGDLALHRPCRTVMLTLIASKVQSSFLIPFRKKVLGRALCL